MSNGESKVDTKKNTVGGIKGLANGTGNGSLKFKKGLQMGSKAMFSNLKNFYEDFVNNNTRTGNKVRSTEVRKRIDAVSFENTRQTQRKS